MAEVGTAWIRVMPETQQFGSTLKSAVMRDSDSTGQSGGKSLSSGLAKGLKIGGAAVVSGAGVLTGALIKGAQSTAKYGGNVDKMSQKIGISAKSYQQWDYVMARAGMSVDSLKMGMKTLSSQAQGNSDAFQKLGISQKEVATMSKEELFDKTVKGLASMKDGTERSALASKLLGRAGADMAPLLNQGTAAIEEQKQMAIDYGMVMSDEAVKASANFEDSMTTMQMTMTGLKNRIMGEFLPSMTQITDGMGKLFKGDMSGLDDINAGIEGFVAKVTANLPMMLDVGTKILTSLVAGIIQSLPRLLACGAQLVMSLGQAIIGLAPTLMSVGLQIIQQIASGIINGLPILLANLTGIINGITAWISSNGDQFMDKGVEWITNLGNGFMKALPSIISNLGSLLNSIVKLVIAIAPKLLAAGLKIIGQLAVGFVRALPKIIAAVAKVAAGAIKGLAKLPGQMLSAGVKAVASLASGFKPGKVLSAAAAIVSGVVGKLKTLPGKVWNAVKSVPGKLANAFKFKFKLPKLPKVRIEMKTGIMGVKYPVLHWNKKGGLFTGPSIVGSEGFGEAGPEYALPLNRKTLAPLAEMIDELRDKKTETSTSVTVNVYASDSKSASEIAQEVERRIIESQKRRRLAWQ